MDRDALPPKTAPRGQDFRIPCRSVLPTRCRKVGESVNASVRRIITQVRQRLLDRSGQAIVEYGLILILVAIAALVGLTFFGHTVSNTLNNSGNTMQHLP